MLSRTPFKTLPTVHHTSLNVRWECVPPHLHCFQAQVSLRLSLSFHLTGPLPRASIHPQQPTTPICYKVHINISIRNENSWRSHGADESNAVMLSFPLKCKLPNSGIYVQTKMERCTRCCLHNSIRAVNLVVNICGAGMIIYSLWLLKMWQDGVSELPTVSSLSRPWYFFPFQVSRTQTLSPSVFFF